MGNSTDQIGLGITDDDIALGSHLIHFWRNEEFEPWSSLPQAWDRERIDSSLRS